MSETAHPQCPICEQPKPPSQRYPNALCRSCASKTVDATGRPVAFYNEGLWGGCVGLYRDDNSPYEGTLAYVAGRPVVAQEARFGGIVIQTC